MAWWVRVARTGLLAALVVGAACTPEAQELPGSETPSAEFAPYGAWRILSVDGVAARSARGQGAGPSVLLWPGGYGGNGGCNGFGGIGVWVDGRWYADPPMMTAMACQGVMDQEMTIAAVLASAPAMRAFEDGHMEARSDVGTLVLTRSSEPLAPPDAAEPALMAGRQFLIHTTDNSGWDHGASTRLDFDADRWRVVSDCGATGGGWRQTGARLELAVDRQDDACDEVAPHLALRNMTGGQGGFAIGPNQEFVIGGSGHWLRGDDRMRPDPAHVMARLAGTWRASRLNARDIRAADAAPFVAFGPAGYFVWDGCNRTEGLAIVHRGDLFTVSSGLSTLVACRPDEVGRAVAAVVTGRPRVAWGEDGALVLITRAGSVRLRKTADAPAGAARPGALTPGLRLELSDSAGRLHLIDERRFTVTQDCAVLIGQWRRRPRLRISSDPPRKTAPGCDLGPGSPAFIASQMFNGDMQAVVDPNGERALIVSDFGSLHGRLVH